MQICCPHWARDAVALLWCAVLSGLLLSMLDQTIVGTALPTIVEDLGGHRWYVWVVSAYLVPATVMILVFTRLSDRHGDRAAGTARARPTGSSTARR